MTVTILTDTQPLTTRQRKRLIADLVRDGITKPGDVAAELRLKGYVNPRGLPFSPSTLRNDVREMQSKQERVQEIIGRTVIAQPLWKHRTAKSYDATRPDYGGWDLLRRGWAKGFKFGGLFCMPLTQIVASFVFGSGVTAALAKTVTASQENIDYTNDLLSRFMSRMHRQWGQLAIDLYGLGDQYVAVNPDGSISMISPELADITTDPQDYRAVTAITVTTRLDRYTITDVFAQDQRTVTVRDGGAGGKAVQQVVYENLTGKLPIVHFANDRGTNELYGRPIYEALYRLFSRYDDLIEKAIDGAELMGNPMPTFEGMENIDETITANTTQDDDEYADKDGNTETRQLLRFDTLGVVFVGKGGSFNFKSPPTGFTEDIRNVLKSLFLLMLDYTRVPEAVWGGAINSSKASAEAQMPPFWQYIQARRLAMEGDGADDELGLQPRGGLYELLDVWLATRALTDPRVVVGPLELKWPELDTAAWDVLLKWVSYLRGIGIMDDLTVLQQFGELEDPEAVLEQAKQESQERQEEQMDFQARLRDEQDSANNDAENGNTNTGQERRNGGTIDADKEPSTQTA